MTDIHSCLSELHKLKVTASLSTIKSVEMILKNYRLPHHLLDFVIDF